MSPAWPQTIAPDARAADFRALREREFPLLGDSPYLNAASTGPLPERARVAMEAYLGRRAAVHTMRGAGYVLKPVR